jgi:hypothetical protein
VIPDAPVLLGQVVDDRAANALAARLVAEGMGAEAEGPRVWVRRADRDEALVLARLFHEVDQGRSRVAPPPGTWLATAPGRALRLAAVAVMLLAALAAVTIAVRL